MIHRVCPCVALVVPMSSLPLFTGKGSQVREFTLAVPNKNVCLSVQERAPKGEG